MPKLNPAKHMTPKFKKVATQPETQTLKANATPRVGQGTRKLSPYHRATMSRAAYGQATASYNVGRTRRLDHKV